jgi:hypothetical protein
MSNYQIIAQGQGSTLTAKLNKYEVSPNQQNSFETSTQQNFKMYNTFLQISI